MAATIIDVLDLRADSPFPGESLSRCWNGSVPTGPTQPPSVTPVLAEVVPHDPLDRDSWGVPKQLPPVGAVKERDWSYIRGAGNAGEELFHLRVDPKEQHNLAADPAALQALRQLRSALDRLAGGPLVPARFNR